MFLEINLNLKSAKTGSKARGKKPALPVFAKVTTTCQQPLKQPRCQTTRETRLIVFLYIEEKDRLQSLRKQYVRSGFPQRGFFTRPGLPELKRNKKTKEKILIRSYTSYIFYIPKKIYENVCIACRTLSTKSANGTERRGIQRAGPSTR